MERKQLNAAHNGIVSLIPEVINQDELKTSNKKSIDLSKNMDTLFREYFKHTKGQEPNSEIMELFSEILAEDEEKN